MAANAEAGRSGANIDNVMNESRLFPPLASSQRRPRQVASGVPEALGRGGRRSGGLLGQAGRRSCTGSSRSTRCSSGTSRLPSGSSAARPTSPYNCLDAHLGTAAAEQGGHHLGRRAGRQPRAHLRRAAPRGLQVRQRAQEAGHRARATWLRSTCRWCPSWPSPCWPVPGSARSTRSIFAGFSAEAIADRNNDASAKLQITADAGWRRGKELPLKETVDEALEKSPTVEKCIVLDRVGMRRRR